MSWGSVPGIDERVTESLKNASDSSMMSSNCAAAVLALSLAATLHAQPAKPDPAHAAVPMCPSNQLSLATDQENGSFDGMSHGGTLVVLRNLGPTACKVDVFPKISFLDGTQILQAKSTVTGAKYMHPGPVVFPVVVAAGAEVTSSVRWVSGEVFDKSVCIRPKAISIAIGSEKQQVPFTATLCGDAGKGVTYEMTRFATDPVYSGK